ncbi:hypothetical protein [Atlantibacter hermannii]|uniref:hypothetical protein n=1 Tax=Atlantibacter hermannii TaxID=565 RepID=UPI0030DE9578
MKVKTENMNVPDGWQIVPKKPTIEMLRQYTGFKGKGWDTKLKRTWEAMLAVAPDLTDELMEVGE